MQPVRFGAYLRLLPGTNRNDATKVLEEFLHLKSQQNNGQIPIHIAGDMTNDGEQYGFVATGDQALLLQASMQTGFKGFNTIA